MLIKNAEVAGNLIDLRLSDVIVDMGRGLVAADEPVVDARGCALLPGLHDHHIHLFAAAVAAESIDCSDLQAGDEAGFVQRLGDAPRAGWHRVVGYHESVAGDLDRHRLDQLSAPVPTRLQHSSGKLWVLNSQALDQLRISEAAHEGIERDDAGIPTGRIWRADDWLRKRLHSDAPDLTVVSQALSAFGITGVTDTSYTNDHAALQALHAARQSGALSQRLYVMGDDSLTSGPLKIMLDEDDLPEFEYLLDRIAAARAAGRSVAFHCVSHVELVFALAALEQTGYVKGDRIEHGGVVRAEVLPQLKKSGVTVVTQPGFVWARGARYQRDAETADLAYIYPFKTLLDAGVPVVASSDAPYGPLDPWLCMATAVSRRCLDGSLLNPGEAVAPATALSGYLSTPQAPAGPPRQIAIGWPADLVLLDRPLKDVYANISAVRPRVTLIAGQLVYDSSVSTS
ncbi:MAG: amidohydrolase family protein [bacterium]